MSELIPDSKEISRTTTVREPIEEDRKPLCFKNVLPADAQKLSPIRIILAFAVAIIADTLIEVIPTPFSQVIDVFTGIALFLVLGANWILLPAFLIEMIPGVGMSPTWILAVAAITLKNGMRK